MKHTGMSAIQRKMLMFLGENHSQWFAIGGVKLQVAAGLRGVGLVEIRGRAGQRRIRISRAGLAWLEAHREKDERTTP